MNVKEIGEFIGAFLILVGSMMSVISAFGILRFPDVYSRAHASTKSSNVAVLLTLFGAFLYFLLTDGTVSIRLILGIVFVFITSPTSGHLILRAAYRSGVKLTETTTVDELKDYIEEQKKKMASQDSAQS